ncbi:MAG: helix-turn-helix domain-containing protein [Bifidobacteriaceae bacterium]|jgi:AraC-like DNA-binding protein|nr:helix-turn-helix domain-containing protein [Bifidobacteriaceae bacterium]
MSGYAPRVLCEGKTITDISAWTQLVARTFAPADMRPYSQAFTATVRAFERGDFHISRLDLTSHRARHRSADIAPHGGGRLVLALQVAGRGIVAQDGRLVQVSAGDVTVFDTSRPYTLVFDDAVTCVGVAAPLVRLGLPRDATATLTAVKVPAGEPVALAVTDTVTALEAQLSALPPLCQHQAVRSILDIFTMFCMHIAGGREPADTGSLDKLLHFVDDHIDDPALDPAKVAAALYMSVRSLHALAHAGGFSVASLIRRRRLDGCRIDLSNPRLAHLTVAEIGARWGLVNPTHFSAMFRSEFGVPPSVFRSEALAARSRPPVAGPG